MIQVFYFQSSLNSAGLCVCLVITRESKKLPFIVSILYFMPKFMIFVQRTVRSGSATPLTNNVLAFITKMCVAGVILIGCLV